MIPFSKSPPQGLGLFYLIAIIPDSFLRTRITTFEPSFGIYLFLVLLQCQAIAMVDKDSATALHFQLKLG